MTAQDKERYFAACHAMQSGVAMEMNDPTIQAHTPKHLRVGVNSALVQSSALVLLLIEKGLFTMDEWEAKMADAMDDEVKAYEQRLTAKNPGSQVHLA